MNDNPWVGIKQKLIRKVRDFFTPSKTPVKKINFSLPFINSNIFSLLNYARCIYLRFNRLSVTHTPFQQLNKKRLIR